MGGGPAGRAGRGGAAVPAHRVRPVPGAPVRRTTHAGGTLLAAVHPWDACDTATPARPPRDPNRDGDPCSWVMGRSGPAVARPWDPRGLLTSAGANGFRPGGTVSARSESPRSSRERGRSDRGSGKSAEGWRWDGGSGGRAERRSGRNDRAEEVTGR